MRDPEIVEAFHEPEGRAPIPCASSLWCGEATDEPAREDARPANWFMAPDARQNFGGSPTHDLQLTFGFFRDFE